MKKNNKKKNVVISRMLHDFKPEMNLIIFVSVVSILSAVLQVYSPVVLKDILSQENLALMFKLDAQLNLHIDWVVFWSKFGTLIAIFLVSALLLWLSEFISVSISARYAYWMRDRVQKKLDTLPLSYFDKVPYGDTLSVATNDVDNISRNLQSIITQLFSGVTLFLGSLLAMIIVNFRLALVALIALPLTVLVVFLVTKFSGKQFLNYRNELGVLNGKIEENYSGYKIIKLFNKEEDVEKDFAISNEKMAKADNMSQFLSGLIWPTTIFINNLAYVGIAVLAGIISDAATMIVFFLFLKSFTSPFQQIGQIANVIQSVVASGERIYSLLDEEEENKDSVDALNDESKITGNFEFKDVSFSYSPDKPLIDAFNLKVNAGDTVAIVGPTGAGKTTIVNLIMRFYEINSGKILLDNVSTQDYKKNCLRGSIGMVLQDTWLFKGTIKENLLYGDPNATDEEIRKACEEAHCMHFIDTLPGGFDFMLNEDGNNVSQGQRQLFTIARAIISKPKILILDEATSSVDTRTEQSIQDALDKIMKGRTSFVIAHRLSTIKSAKLIIVMKKGHIVETGNHKELLAKNGFYADLYNAQFSGSNPMEKNQEKEDS